MGRTYKLDTERPCPDRGWNQSIPFLFFSKITFYELGNITVTFQSKNQYTYFTSLKSYLMKVLILMLTWRQTFTHAQGERHVIGLYTLYSQLHVVDS